MTQIWQDKVVVQGRRPGVLIAKVGIGGTISIVIILDCNICIIGHILKLITMA